MDAATPLVWIAAALGLAGVAALRFAWSLPRRSPGVNATGWGLVALAVIAAGAAEGAWGVAVAALCAMLAAFVLLAHAAITAPAGRAGVSNRRVGMLPERGEPRRIGRRITTFVLTILVGLIVSVGLALATRMLGLVFGAEEANANALALFMTPLAWAVLCTILLLQTRRRIQVTTLLICTVPVLPVLLTGAWS